ncbi:MAG: hypothetical protein ACYSTS_16380 [Planctomycetota bacterium]
MNILLNEHYERIAGVIETLEPDIVNLVETTSLDGLEHLVNILHEKGLNTYKAYHIKGNDPTGKDISFISKIEPDQIDGKHIRKFYSKNLNGKWRAKYKWIKSNGDEIEDDTSITKNAVYCFTIGSHKLGFLGLHLKAIPDNPKANGQRTGQSIIAQTIIKDEIVGRGYKPIVLGDINDFDPHVADRDDSSDTQTNVLSNLKDYDSIQAGFELINVAKEIARKKDRYTAHYDKNHNDIPEANEPMTMIDHILIHKDLEPNIERVFIDHGHGAQTSDHWPIVLDMVLE